MAYKSKIKFSRQELMDFIRIDDERTISNYIKNGILPAPTIINEEQYFDRDYIFSLLGITHLPEEKFMTPDEACKYLDIDQKSLSTYVKVHSVPNYKLFNRKGVRTLFLKSELDKYIELKLEWDYVWVNKAIRDNFTTGILKNFLNSNVIDDIYEDDKKIFYGAIIDKKTTSQLAEEFKIKAHYIPVTIKKVYDKLLNRINIFNNSYAFLHSTINENLILKNENNELKKINQIRQLNIESIEKNTINLKTRRVENFLKKSQINSIQHLAQFKKSATTENMNKHTECNRQIL